MDEGGVGGMANESELVRTAYEQCGVAYNTAVEVSKYTWTMFYTRTAALLGAAGYVVLEHPAAAWLGALLLLIGAWATHRISQAQVASNQNVIRKILAAGLLLERENPALGYRYRLDAWGDQLDETASLDSLVNGLKDQDIGSKKLRDLGLTPKFEKLLMTYSLMQVAFAGIALLFWTICWMIPTLFGK